MYFYHFSVLSLLIWQISVLWTNFGLFADSKTNCLFQWQQMKTNEKKIACLRLVDFAWAWAVSIVRSRTSIHISNICMKWVHLCFGVKQIHVSVNVQREKLNYDLVQHISKTNKSRLSYSLCLLFLIDNAKWLYETFRKVLKRTKHIICCNNRQMQHFYQTINYNDCTTQRLLDSEQHSNNLSMRSIHCRQYVIRYFADFALGYIFIAFYSSIQCSAVAFL